MSDLIYRIIFSNQDQVYELCAKQLSESEMYGFLEIQDLVFEESSTQPLELEIATTDNDEDDVAAEPGLPEKTLREEFKGVKRIYIPCHAVIRIDELTRERQGKAKIKSLKGGQSNVSHLKPPPRDKK